MSEGIELPNQEKIRTLGEKENYKYLGILEADIIKQNLKKEYRRRAKKVLKTKLYGRNLMGFPSDKRVGTILKMGLGRTSTNGQDNKKTHEDA